MEFATNSKCPWNVQMKFEFFFLSACDLRNFLCACAFITSGQFRRNTWKRLSGNWRFRN
jgi:hypothetical protein